MSTLSRRRALTSIAMMTAGPVALRLAHAQSPTPTPTPTPTPRVVAITARRFAFEPAAIALKAGETVTVEVRSLDFVHGFNLPDLGRRYDLVPGQPVRFELHPDKPGNIDFVCDNFCGEGHERMHGSFVVSA